MSIHNLLCFFLFVNGFSFFSIGNVLCSDRDRTRRPTRNEKSATTAAASRINPSSLAVASVLLDFFAGVIAYHFLSGRIRSSLRSESQLDVFVSEEVEEEENEKSSCVTHTRIYCTKRGDDDDAEPL